MMRAEWEGGHPAEGTLHAWIDGALDADESARLEAHVAGCGACQASVAEVRGLVAGASRVVQLLDDQPPVVASVGDGRTPGPAVARADSVWRTFRVTPARAAIAAAVIVAVGIAFTRDHVAIDPVPMARESATAAGARGSASSGQDVRPPATMPGSGADPATAREVAASASPPAGPPERDSVLRGAIARRLASDQPARTLEPSRTPAIPSVPVSTGALTRMDTTSAREVMQQRAASRMAAVTGDAAADKLAAKTVSAAPADAGCYRIDPLDAMPQDWGGVPLPVNVSLTGTVGAADAFNAPRYAILPATGGAQIGAWSRTGGDTLSIVLQGVSATTNGLLVSSGSALSGALRAVRRAGPTGAQFRAAPMSVASAPIRVAAHRIACAP